MLIPEFPRNPTYPKTIEKAVVSGRGLGRRGVLAFGEEVSPPERGNHKVLP